MQALEGRLRCLARMSANHRLQPTPLRGSGIAARFRSVRHVVVTGMTQSSRRGWSKLLVMISPQAGPQRVRRQNMTIDQRPLRIGVWAAVSSKAQAGIDKVSLEDCERGHARALDQRLPLEQRRRRGGVVGYDGSGGRSVGVWMVNAQRGTPHVGISCPDWDAWWHTSGITTGRTDRSSAGPTGPQANVDHGWCLVVYTLSFLERAG
jgi:hypothetical protein